jgi:hypothetical protein
MVLFLILVVALDLQAPIWLVVAISVLGVLVGRLGVERAKESVAT